LNIFVFDIETIPDVTGGRKIFKLDNLSDAEVATAMYARQQQQTGHEFLPCHLQKIIAISIVLYSKNTIKIWSLGEEDSPEEELIDRFYTGINKYMPVLVSWNGAGFDLPVLHYRSLIHGITASTYWETGANEPSFKWNNYLNRYHSRHLDLMDVLSGFNLKSAAKLDEVATLLGLPGKLGLDGSKVWDTYQSGNIKAIRNYCEIDVINTFLIYLRYELIRGNLNNIEYQREIERLQNTMAEANQEHFAEFLNLWDNSKIPVPT